MQKILSNNILDTGINHVKNVENYVFGKGSISYLKKIIDQQNKNKKKNLVFFIDIFFKSNGLPNISEIVEGSDLVLYVDSSNEPTTTAIDSYTRYIKNYFKAKPSIIIGIGGGCTMDIAKAVSNLLNNYGDAENYQGWDLLKKPGVFKIGIPTISGTGAESTRTCVMTNTKSGLKLGMNSDYTVFNQIILDPDLTKTVPSDQYFWTGMDAYIHCIESLSGRYRNPVGDSFSKQTIQLCRDIFNSNDMKSDANREKLMIASYLGGCAIATSYVGLIHPLSAALTVKLGIHHCLANCIIMRGIHEFYPSEYNEFWNMVKKQNIKIPKDVCKNLNENQLEDLYDLTIIHEKPLTNALGNNFQEIFTKKKVIEIFKSL